MKENRLKTLLATGQTVLAPGVYDPLSALIAQQAGFDALYLSGASIAYSHLGRSDIGLTTFTEVADTLSRITERVDSPVIVDGDTGFGNALNVQRTVRGFERAGAAMIQLEDQAFPKRCGHLAGKTLVAAHEMRGKLKAALDRAEQYLDCGIDALFIEALQTPAQIDAACARFASRIPLLANMVEGGKTPIESAQALAQRGFRIVIFPGGTMRAVAHTLQGYYASLRQHGTTAPWRDKMLDFDGLNAVIGTPELLELGRGYESI